MTVGIEEDCWVYVAGNMSFWLKNSIDTGTLFVCRVVFCKLLVLIRLLSYYLSYCERLSNPSDRSIYSGCICEH